MANAHGSEDKKLAPDGVNPGYALLPSPQFPLALAQHDPLIHAKSTILTLELSLSTTTSLHLEGPADSINHLPAEDFTDLELDGYDYYGSLDGMTNAETGH
jgi:hypothetical protein